MKSRSSLADQAVHQTESALGGARVPMARQLRVVELVRTIARDTGRHHVAAFAGNLAYNSFLAIIPFLLFLVLVLRALHASDFLSSLVDVVSASLPASSANLLRDQVQAEVASRLPEVWFLSALLAVGSLWACSSAFRAVAAAVNVMYDTRDDRSLWLQLAHSIALSLGTAALFLCAFALVQATSLLVADTVAAPFALIWNAARAITVIASAFVGFAATCRLAPQVKRPVRAILPGALFATLVWVLFSSGFALVFNLFGAFLVDPLYGWFTGVFALMLYFYWSSFILLLGAEVNHAIEGSRPG